MAKLVEFVLKLTDKFSSPLRGFQNATDKATKGYIDANGRMRDANGRFLKSVQDTTSKSSSAFKSLSGVLGGIGFAALAAGAYKAGEFIVGSGVKMEQTRVQFETFTGSLEKGNAVIKQLQQFSLATPFDDEQVLQAGKSLLAFGVTTEELQSKLTQIGNISSATGKDFNELTTIFGKAKTAGTLYAEDINQLVEAGVPIIDEFAKQLGVPASQVKKLASEGKISFSMLEKGFDNLGGATGKWGQLMDKQSKTVGGKFSSLVGYIQNMGAELGETQLPVFANFIDNGIAVLDWIKTNKANIGKLFEPLMKAFQPLQESFSRIQKMFGDTGTVGEKLSKVFEYIGYAAQLISPFIEAVATVLGSVYENVAKVILVFVEWFKKNKELQANLVGLYNIFKTVFGAIASIAGKVFGGISTAIDGILNRDFSKIGKGLKDIVAAPIQVAFNKDTYKPLLDGAPTLTNYFGGKGKEADSATTEARSGAAGAKSALATATAAKAKDTSLKTKVGDVAGSKPTTINITIQKLTGIEQLHTMNIKESTSDLEKLIKEAILTTLSDASLLANK